MTKTYTDISDLPLRKHLKELSGGGVTGGDSHNHGGGLGGGTINHLLLTNIGVNTHAQIDTHIADTANPHATTAAQVGAPALSLVTAKGDILAATASGVLAKLTVGTNAWSLVADSSEPTGLKWADVSAAGVTDHGALTGLGDDDHTIYIRHALATATSDFLVGASGGGSFEKKTLAETKTLLGIGSGWYQAVRKSADESVTSDTTLQNDNELLFAVGANETWSFEFTLFNTTGSPGLQLRLMMPANSTSLMGFVEMKRKDDTSSGEDGNIVISIVNFGGKDYSNQISHTWGNTGTGYTRIFGTVIIGANAGNITLQWAQSSSSGTTAAVLAGSYLTARRIA